MRDGHTHAPVGAGTHGHVDNAQTLDTLLDMARRNIDALTAVSRLAIDCATRCGQLQTRTWTALAGQAGATASGATAPAEAVTASLSHLRDLSAIVVDTNREALALIHRQSEACLEEIDRAARRCADAFTAFDPRILPPPAGAPKAR
ncbi:MAG: hypothetical protein R3F55_09060 [Alphaproteobacteria bacterium]